MHSLYSIPVSGQKEGSHIYDFKIDTDFFSSFEKSVIHEADLNASINLLKRSAHMELVIKISGTVKLTCDRCLDLYSQAVDTENRVLIKFGDKLDEMDDEILVIPHNINELDLSQLLYEFTHLGLPLRKMHPDDENGNSTCNPRMLEKLEQHLIRSDAIRDPRWNELEKLKNSNN